MKGGGTSCELVWLRLDSDRDHFLTLFLWSISFDSFMHAATIVARISRVRVEAKVCEL